MTLKEIKKWLQKPLPTERISSEAPFISIVVPSFNQGQYIESTIRSVLLQHYPHYELIIMDGGSTDNTIDIIKKYEASIDYWQSGPDGGQSAAINQGMQKAKGKIVNWLNSDDFLLPGALKAIVEAFAQQPDAVAISGNAYYLEHGKLSASVPARPGNKDEYSNWYFGGHIVQPACYFTRQAFQQVGGLKEHLHYMMDVDLWMRLSDLGPMRAIDRDITCIQVHEDMKSNQVRYREAEKLAITVMNGCSREAIDHKINHYLNRMQQLSGENQKKNKLNPFSLIRATWKNRFNQ
jgi:glycosyltransferase involved in cell wall biosynthesis